MTVSETSVLSRFQYRIPDSRRTFTVAAELVEVGLSLPHPVQQFNTGNCDGCGL